jgi:hypothetical protein
MTERMAQELELLRTGFPKAELREDLWARIPAYPIDKVIWGRSRIEVAFRFVLPGQLPYGFWVRPGLALPSEVAIQSYGYPVDTPFGPGWGQFSWTPDNWSTGDNPKVAGNMLRWALSFAQRLAEEA